MVTKYYYYFGGNMKLVTFRCECVKKNLYASRLINLEIWEKVDQLLYAVNSKYLKYLPLL